MNQGYHAARSEALLSLEALKAAVHFLEMASRRGTPKKVTLASRRRTAAKPVKKVAAKDLVSDRWRYFAVKHGASFYITEIAPGAHGRQTRLFRAPGGKVRFKRSSTIPEKLTKAFAAAVKSAP